MINEIILLRQKRKQHLKKITGLFGCPDKTLIIHYSCTNFKELPIRIGSISVQKLNEPVIKPFFLEGEGTERSEKLMLEEFIAFIKDNEYATYINWNMRVIVKKKGTTNLHQKGATFLKFFMSYFLPI